MVKIPVYDAQGKEVRSVDFDESVFGDKVLTKTLHTVVVAYARNKRQGTHSTKTRSDVSGSRRKMWKQKGTGRARAGDKRPPHWRGGGVAHGPHPRNYVRRIPARLRQTALASAMLGKLRDGEVCAVEGLSFEHGPRTKVVAGFLAGAGFRSSEGKGSALIATLNHDENLAMSARNLSRTSVRMLRELNAYDLLMHKRLVLTVDALEQLGSGGDAE